MWIAIVIGVAVLLYAAFIFIYQIRNNLKGKAGFDDCGCCHSKGKDLVKAYKAMKKKENTK